MVKSIFAISLALFVIGCLNVSVDRVNPYDIIYEGGDYKIILKPAESDEISQNILLKWDDVTVVKKSDGKTAKISDFNFVEGFLARTAENTSFSETDYENIINEKSIAFSAGIAEKKTSIVKVDNSFKGEVFWVGLNLSKEYSFIIEIKYLNAAQEESFMHSNIVKYGN